MKSVLADLRDREYSVKRLLEHIEELSDERGKVELIVVLKSSFFIALYNNIEATVFSVLEQIHCHLSNYSYQELAPPLKEKMLKYFFGRSESVYMKEEDKVKCAEIELISSRAKFPSLFQYLKKQTLFSGNIDVRKLGEISRSYAIPAVGASLECKDKEMILMVKNKRNKIAHGELSMSDAGKMIKNSELIRAYDAVRKALICLVESTDKYLTEEMYRDEYWTCTHCPQTQGASSQSHTGL